MIDRLLRRLTGDDGPFHECRSCGKTLESADEPCSGCGSEDIATYEWI